MTPNLSSVGFAAVFALFCLALSFPSISALVVGGASGNPNLDSCSGNGNYYSDIDACECYQCFEGPECSQQVPSCFVEASAGDPHLYQQYWDSHPSLANIEIEGRYRTGYQKTPAVAPGTTKGFLGKLRTTLEDLHAMVGNVDPSNHYLVIGDGCSQLIGAATYAASMLSDGPVTLFAREPYYFGYSRWASIGSQFTTLNFSSSMNLAARSSSLLEMVTSPNNPTGHQRSPVYDSPYTVYDMVYNWPSLTNTTQLASFDKMFFSLSKMSGHAGSRFGWAWVKDKAFADSMSSFISALQIHVPIEPQFRAMRVIQTIIDTKGDIFDYLRDKLQDRWLRVLSLFSQRSDRFSIQSVPGQFYVWIQCLLPGEAKDCAAVFTSLGVEGEAGTKFGAGNDYVRLELVEYDPVFEIFMKNLHGMIADTSVRA